MVLTCGIPLEFRGGVHLFIFPVQLTTGRIGNLTQLIHTLAICDDHTVQYFEKRSVGHVYSYKQLLLQRHYSSSSSRRDTLVQVQVVFVLIVKSESI